MAYLRLYKGDALQNQWKVESDLISIGRSEANDIVLPSTGVSKHHAIIVRENHSMVIIDQDSSNGVYVNNEKVQRRKLQYWDDIQIFEYVLKFMASARLPGEQEATDLDLDTEMRDESTREFRIGNIRELEELRREKRVPHIREQSATNGNPIFISSANFYIGRSSQCDICLSGWFKPRVSGQIQRRSNDFYLTRKPRGKILVNGRRLKNEIRLKDDDDLVIHNKHYKFYFRPLGKA
jgi:predicted component of type VI protein secretion system